jgi:hypothetical protein
MGADMPYMDGNAAAGEIGSLLAIDVTVARGACAGCGVVATLAEARMYGPAPGLVLRCPACEAVLLRVVQAAERAWLDLRGLSYLELPAPA